MKGKNSILIVDDEKSNLLYLNHILSTDYTIYTARNAQEGIERAHEYCPDLILLDIIMPGMDGYGVLAVLKQSEKTRDIPVVFITGMSSTDDEVKGLDLGAADYITKPFSDAVVKLRVQNQIKIKNQASMLIEKEITEKCSRVKADFLSRMSHEMRTPMNAIIGMTTLAQNTDDPEEREDYLIKAGNASQDLLRLIDDVLDMSGMDEGGLNLTPSEFNFMAMVQSIFDEANLHFAQKNQVFTSSIDPSVPEFLICDKKRLSQLIKNLLSNAGKFTGAQGMIHFRAFALNTENDSATIQIEITDSGIGIPPEHQENIFSAFEQLDGGTKRKYGGIGLGLYISKKIVEMMGGRIWVESDLAQGSKFAFTFKSQIKIPDKKKDEPVSFCGKTALLAEDVEINCEIIKAMLKDTQLQLVCAANGREAVELFSADPDRFDIILMDINMPEMDGIEATQRIRAIESERSAALMASELTPDQKSMQTTQLSGQAKRVPVIALTANVLPAEIRNYLAAGMVDHIGKPIDFNLLIQKINLYIDKCKPAIELSA